MRNKIILYVILIFTFVTTQVTFINSASIFGVTPNIVIILIVSISLLEGRIDGAAVGFSIGLCVDAVIGIALGINALIGMLLGLLLGNINKRFFKENILVMVICTFVSTILYEAATVAAYFLVGLKVNFLATLQNVVLPEALFNSILGIAIFYLIIFINRKMIGTESKNKY
jgi:rod shape-determining protein MreD